MMGAKIPTILCEILPTLFLCYPRRLHRNHQIGKTLISYHYISLYGRWSNLGWFVLVGMDNMESIVIPKPAKSLIDEL